MTSITRHLQTWIRKTVVKLGFRVNAETFAVGNFQLHIPTICKSAFDHEGP